MDSNHHVVLQIGGETRKSKAVLIERLAQEMPEHSVFDSGSGTEAEWVTIMPVIDRNLGLEHLPQIRVALAEYTASCSSLLSKFRRGVLEKEWATEVHGGHCCFTNSITGEEVEAALSGKNELNEIDPFFFAKFVKSTSRFSPIAGLIGHNFHDARRMLETVVEAEIRSFKVNQRVRVKPSPWAFAGVTGTIVNIPAAVAQIDPEPWQGHFQFKKRRMRL